jgi:spermidine synthase
MVMGFTALVAQVVLARELLSLFLGNELTIALVLAMWLLIVAAGSAIGARATRLSSRQNAFAWSQLAAAFLLPTALLVARRIGFGGVGAGEALSLGAVLLVSFETLLPACLPLGFQFVLAASAATRDQPDGVGPLARVYAAESAGAVLGGVAFHLYLSQHAPAFTALSFLALLNAASAAWLLRAGSGGKRSWQAGAAAVCLMLVLLGLSSRIDLAATRSSPRWSGYTVLSQSPSRYGDLVSAMREGQLAVFQSGVLVFSTESEETDEIAAHLPLLEHPHPKTVLLIGGALGGLPREILQHPVERLDAVELDPGLQAEAARAARAAHLSESVSAPLGDPRFRLRFGDARRVVRGATGRYDVIVLATPDPTTAALNRFYTGEFFAEARRALAPGGLLAFGLSGSQHMLTGPLLLAAASASRTVHQVFADVLLVPGDRMLFLASTGPGGMSRDPSVLAGRLKRRGVRTHFVNETWLRDALLPFRAASLEDQLRQVTDPPVNTDLDPVSYYHQYRIWMDQVSPGLAPIAAQLSRIKVWWGAVPLAAALLTMPLVRRREGFRRRAVLLAVAGIGGFGMAVEITGLLVFQSALGYLYHALGMLVAGFMAGLAWGALAIGQRQLAPPAARRMLIAALLSSALISALLPSVFRCVMPVPALAGAAVAAVFLLVGSLAGAAFPIAAAIYRAPSGIAAAGGALYAADLVGSAGGALLAGALLLPLLGVTGASHLMALLLLAPLALVLAARAG